MKRISVYFFDGKSLAFTLDEGEYEKLVSWVNDTEDLKPFKLISNKMEHFIFKTAIEYIIA